MYLTKLHRPRINIYLMLIFTYWMRILSENKLRITKLYPDNSRIYHYIIDSQDVKPIKLAVMYLE